MPEHEGLAEDLALIEDAVRGAGDTALKHFRGGMRGWSKADGTPVSDADLAVNRELADRLLAPRPDYGWLSEESLEDLESRQAERTYIVDPIDGTRAFLSGGDDWCIGVGLLCGGRPIAAAVLQPTAAALYSAAAGMGARKNGRPIQVSSRDKLEGAHLIAHSGLRRPERWTVPWPRVRYGMTFAMLLRLCRVADGSVDGMVALGRKSDWDIAPGDLIVQESGGLVTDLNGAPPHYGSEPLTQNGILAGGRQLMDRMIPLARGYRE